MFAFCGVCVFGSLLSEGVVDEISQSPSLLTGVNVSQNLVSAIHESDANCGRASCHISFDMI